MRNIAFAVASCAVVVVSSVIAVPAAAQADSPGAAQLQTLRDRIRIDKKGVVAKNMPLTEAEAAKFWPLYEAWQKDLDALQRRRSRAILDFVSAKDRLTDANAKRIAEEVLVVEQEQAKLSRTMFRKLAGVLPAKKAARYLQIESKIDSLYRYDLALAIPLAE